MDLTEDNNTDDMIEVEFEVFEPLDSDLDGIVNNLQQVLPPDIDPGEFGKMTIKSNDTAYLIKQAFEESEISKQNEENGESDFVFGILAWIPMNTPHLTGTTNVMDFMKKYLVDYEIRTSHTTKKSIENNESLVSFSDIFSSDHIDFKNYNVGCLVNERFCSIPPQIAPQLFSQFLSDHKRTYDQDNNPAYDYVLCLTRVHQVCIEDGGAAVPKKKSNKGKGKKEKADSSNKKTELEIWMCPEMELLYQERVVAMDIPLHDGSNDDYSVDEGKNFARFFVIAYSKLEPCIERIVEKYGKSKSISPVT